MAIDAVKNEIYVGANVIYNLSGTLAYGKVEKINKKLSLNAFHKRLNYIVHIRYIDGVKKHGKGKHISKIGNTEGVIVIG